MARRKNSKNIPLGIDDSFKRIGLTLRDARRLQGQSIKEVSEQLRISVDYLSKLESGAFHELPAPAYVKGFLRSYGHYLDLASDPLVARYAALAAGKDKKPSHKMPMTTRPPQRSAPAVASMLVVFAAVSYGGWFWLKGNVENTLGTTTLTNKIEEPLKSKKIATLDASIDGYANAISGDVEDQTVESINVVDVGARALNLDNKSGLNEQTPAVLPKMLQAKDAPAIAELQEIKTFLSNTDMPILLDNGVHVEPDLVNSKLPDQFEQTQVLAAPFLNSAELQNNSIAVANLRDPSQEITIRAVAASWVEIVRDNGEEVLAKLMQAGDVYVVDGNTRLYLSTGNAGGLTIVIGVGDPIAVGDIGEIVRDLPLVIDKLRNVM